MKNQYFGDARDYFKYDLLDHLASGLSGVEALTCVWMLTRPDKTGQGNVEFVADEDLVELTDFFRSRLEPRDEARCRVAEMAEYFAGRPYEFFSYRDGREDFDQRTRDDYFRQIPPAALQRAVVFFDPDTGMEPATCRPAHLRYAELLGVLQRMGGSSTAVVFQYQRRTHDWMGAVQDRLREQVSPHVASIKEGPLAFYVLARTAERIQEVRPVLDEVATRRRPVGSSRRLVG